MGYTPGRGPTQDNTYDVRNMRRPSIAAQQPQAIAPYGKHFSEDPAQLASDYHLYMAGTSQFQQPFYNTHEEESLGPQMILAPLPLDDNYMGQNGMPVQGKNHPYPADGQWDERFPQQQSQPRHFGNHLLRRRQLDSKTSSDGSTVSTSTGSTFSTPSDVSDFNMQPMPSGLSHFQGLQLEAGRDYDANVGNAGRPQYPQYRPPQSFYQQISAPMPPRTILHPPPVAPHHRQCHHTCSCSRYVMLYRL